jgi:hypothetical protein
MHLLLLHLQVTGWQKKSVKIKEIQYLCEDA